MRLAVVALAVLSLPALSACTESKQARRAATWSDKPADIVCWS